MEARTGLRLEVAPVISSVLHLRELAALDTALLPLPGQQYEVTPDGDLTKERERDLTFPVPPNFQLYYQVHDLNFEYI